MCTADITDDELCVAPAVEVAAFMQAEGYGHGSVARKGSSFERQLLAGAVTSSPATACSLLYNVQLGLGIPPWEGSHSVRLPAAQEEVPADYVPLGNRERPPPAPEPDADALEALLVHTLVRWTCTHACMLAHARSLSAFCRDLPEELPGRCSQMQPPLWTWSPCGLHSHPAPRLPCVPAVLPCSASNWTRCTDWTAGTP